MIQIELFPFDKIDKGSNIIIYGYGNVGLNYYLQIKKTSYCNLVAFADKNAAQIKHPIANLISIEELINLRKVEYDKIIIAVGNIDVVDEIRRSLIESGMEESIIVEPFSPSAIGDFSFFNYFSERLLIGDMKLCKIEVLRCMETLKRINTDPYEIVNFLYYTVSKRSDFKAMSTADRFDMMGFSEWASFEEQLMLICIAYYNGEFDSDCLKKWMLILKGDNWKDRDDTPVYATLYSDHPMRFEYKNSVYPGFYNDRREMLKKICSFYQLSLSRYKDNIESNEENRIVVVLYILLYLEEAWEKIPVRYINGFCRHGYKVKVVVLDLTINTEGDNISIPRLYEHYIPDDHEKKAREWFEKGVEVEYIDEDNLGSRMQKSIDVICEYNPSFILDISDEYFPQGYVLKDRFPIIYFPLKGFSSSAYFDMYLTNDEESVLKEGNIPKEKIKGLHLGNLNDIEDTIEYDRDDLGLSVNDFVIVTVGKRLSAEVDQELASEVCRIMGDDPSIRWVIIGSEPGVKVQQLETYKGFLADGRIIQKKYEYFLQSFLKNCDVLLQPNRQGGGATVKLAMQIGLPVAMTDYPSDNLKRMEGHVVKGGYKELMEYIIHLKNSQDFRKSEGEEMRKLIGKYSTEEDIRQVIEACEEAASKFRRRRE